MCVDKSSARNRLAFAQELTGRARTHRYALAPCTTAALHGCKHARLHLVWISLQSCVAHRLRSDRRPFHGTVASEYVGA
jgi:hypothetical protein